MKSVAKSYVDYKVILSEEVAFELLNLAPLIDSLSEYLKFNFQFADVKKILNKQDKLPQSVVSSHRVEEVFT